MDDLVERARFLLRDWDGEDRFHCFSINATMLAHLVDQNEALTKRVAELEGELRFIAAVIDDNIKETGEPHAIIYEGERYTGPAADLCIKLFRGIERVARQALKGSKS